MIPLVMLAITSAFTDDDGVALDHSTWAVGATQEEALEKFTRACPSMARNLKSVRVVTPDPAKEEDTEARIARAVRHPIEVPERRTA